MKDIWLFRIAATLLLCNAFLVSNDLPNGLSSIKELGLWLGAGTACIFVCIKLIKCKIEHFQIKLIDIIVIVFQILYPLCFIFMNDQLANINIILDQTALGFIYVVFRILSAHMRPVVFTNAVIEVWIVLILLHLFVGAAQCFGLLPSYSADGSITGMFSNSGPFAIFTAMLGGIVWILLLNSILQKKYFSSCFYLILFFAISYFVINSLSRSAWLGGISGLTVGGMIMFERSFRSNKRIGVFARIFRNNFYTFLILFILLLVPICFWLYQFKENSAVGRLLTWKATIGMIKDNSFHGVGPGNFAANYFNYQADFFCNNFRDNVKYESIAGDIRFAFNDILEVTAEKGIVGLLLFMTIVFLYLRSIVTMLYLFRGKPYGLLCSCIATSLTILTVAGITSYPLTTLPISIFFWFIVAILSSLDQSRYILKVKAVSWLKYVFVVGVFLSAMIYIYSGLTTLNVYRRWQSAMKINDIYTRTEKLLDLYGTLNMYPEFLSNLSESYILCKNYNSAIPVLKQAIKVSPFKEFYYDLGMCYEKSGQYDIAEIQYKKVRCAIPNLLKPRYLLAKMYYASGDYKLFKKMATETIDFKPKVNSPEAIEMKRDLIYLLQR